MLLHKPRRLLGFLPRILKAVLWWDPRMRKRKAKQESAGIVIIDVENYVAAGSAAAKHAKKKNKRKTVGLVQLLDEQEQPSHSRRRSSSKQGDDRNDDVNDDPFALKPPPNDARVCYYDWCVHWMSMDFPRATLESINWVLKCHCKRLGPSYEAMHRVYKHALDVEQGRELVLEERDLRWLPPKGFKLNKAARTVSSAPWEACPVFEREFAAVRAKYDQMAVVCQDIECGCCFSDHSFEQLVQCADGHLFCFGCLKRHVEEATFGGQAQHQSSLPCMDTAGCTAYFPWSEVSRALPAEVLSKYEQRLAEDSVARAKLEGLVYCPFCNFPCELDPGFRVLECPNPPCKKSSCLNCKEPEHSPLECHEVEKEPETVLRRHVEELMTKAYIRECIACKAELVKVDGCNKITCRCGQIMCYLCRQGIQKRTKYAHFCEHFREPGKGCSECTKCGLWEEEESDAKVQAAKEAAIEEAAHQEPNILNRRIGPDDEEQ